METDWLDEMVNNIDDAFNSDARVKRVSQIQNHKRPSDTTQSPIDRKRWKPSNPQNQTDWLDQMVTKIEEAFQSKGDNQRGQRRKISGRRNDSSHARIVDLAEYDKDTERLQDLSEECDEPSVVVELVGDVTLDMLKEGPIEVVESVDSEAITLEGNQPGMSTEGTQEDDADERKTHEHNKTRYPVIESLEAGQLPVVIEKNEDIFSEEFWKKKKMRTPQAPTANQQEQRHCPTVTDLPGSVALQRRILVEESQHHSKRKPQKKKTCRHLLEEASCKLCAIHAVQWDVKRYGRGKTYKCPLCNFTTTNTSSVKLHTFTHTGEKPFGCPICTYRTYQKCHLNTHMLIHTGEKDFECEVCGFRVNSKSHLNSHMRVHSAGLTCDKCEFVCRGPMTMRKHKATHV